ncbi:MAG: hypothetical protein GX627_00980 [Parcubacteria group bacterium]|nr:hypothetical protein [Parcubacteria group bacterium]
MSFFFFFFPSLPKKKGGFMGKKPNRRVEEALNKLRSGDESARKTLQKLGQKGAQKRWAKEREKSELQEELRLLKEEKNLEEVLERLHQGNEIKFPPH